MAPLAAQFPLGSDEQLRGGDLPQQAILRQQFSGPTNRLNDVPHLVLRKGGVPAVAVPHVPPQRVVEVLPVLEGAVGRRTLRTGRTTHPALDLKTVEGYEVARLAVLNLLEEME
jgi:hypothetical protein